MVLSELNFSILFQYASIRAWIDLNRILNPNEAEVGMIQIDSDRKYGLDESKVGLNRNEKFDSIVSDSLGLIPRI